MFRLQPLAAVQQCIHPPEKTPLNLRTETRQAPEETVLHRLHQRLLVYKAQLDACTFRALTTSP